MIVRDFLLGLLLSFVVVGVLFFSLVAVVLGGDELGSMKAFLDSGDDQPSLGVAEDAHMRDVFFVLAWSRVLVSLSILLLLFVVSEGLSRSSLVVTSAMLFVLPVALLLLPWDVLFSGMHAVLFPQGNWTFPASSPLLALFPMNLFVIFAAWWAGLIVFVGACIGLGTFLKRTSHHN